tara:strand:+ start:636 stop:941 length:306 start_codon:yes stop_codon:yes gene_type:complete
MYIKNSASSSKHKGLVTFSRSPNFYIWLIEKRKNNNQNLKIRLEYNRMDSVLFQRYFSYTETLAARRKKTSRTNSTFGFCRNKSQRRKNQKSYFLANAPMK